MNIITFADTHLCHKEVIGFKEKELYTSNADMIICAGDFCNTGEIGDVIRFNNWFFQLPHKYKILIAGNHDRIFELQPDVAQVFLNKNIIYLQDEEVIIEGIKFYGTPWQLPFNNWAFNLPEEELDKKFSKIPNDVDVLITHSPPYGILDSIPSRSNLGSKSLLKHVLRITPKVHIFGHIHGGYGMWRDEENNIVFINASVLDEDYRLINRCTRFSVNK